jgi:CheY-like chemotaxis protein
MVGCVLGMHSSGCGGFFHEIRFRVAHGCREREGGCLGPSEERTTTSRGGTRGYFVVLVDWRMPIMDGLTFIQLAFADVSIHPCVRCVVITANFSALSPASVSTMFAGEVPYLSKPFSIRDLLKTVAAAAASLPPM